MSLFSRQKNPKKSIDKGGGVWYISQARLRGTAEERQRTLKTIQRVNAQLGREDSEDSKEFSIERC